MGTEWATIDSILPEKDLHTKGTIVKTRNGITRTEFWLSQPRPEGYSVDEWDRILQEKWDRIFKKGGIDEGNKLV